MDPFMDNVTDTVTDNVTDTFTHSQKKKYFYGPSYGSLLDPSCTGTQ